MTRKAMPLGKARLKMSKGLYFAYQKAWRKEQPANKYDLTPAAALMLRAIIDEVNAQFWPGMPVKIDNQCFYNTCNFSNRVTVKRNRDQLIKKGLISWHADAAHKNESGFYKVLWKPDAVKKEINKQIEENRNVTPAPFELRIING